jgi:AcrR family transcriptional regulator
MDRDGIDAFSMRRLAAELGVTVQALYWHFDNKDALCLAVVERARNELAAVPLGRGAPVRRLERHLRALRSHWRAHPSAMALGRRYPPTAAGGFVEQGLALVEELGFTADDARQAYRALVWAVLGFVFIEQGVRDSVHHRPLDASGRRYEVTVDDEIVGGSSVVDTEALFDDLLRFTLGGLVASAP